MVLLHQFHVAMSQTIADLEDGEHAVNDGGDGTNGNKGVHIRRAVEEGFETGLVILIVEVHDGQGQQKLNKSKGEGIFHTREETWNRCAHHMAHGDIEQGNQENEGPHQPVFHPGQLLGHDVLLGCCLGLRRFLGEGGAVAGGRDRADDLVRRHRPLVVCDLHVVGQQVDIHSGHAGGFADGLFHMGRAGRTGHTCNVKGLFH